MVVGSLGDLRLMLVRFSFDAWLVVFSEHNSLDFRASVQCYGFYVGVRPRLDRFPTDFGIDRNDLNLR